MDELSPEINSDVWCNMTLIEKLTLFFSILANTKNNVIINQNNVFFNSFALIACVKLASIVDIIVPYQPLEAAQDQHMKWCLVETELRGFAWPKRIVTTKRDDVSSSVVTLSFPLLKFLTVFQLCILLRYSVD